MTPLTLWHWLRAAPAPAPRRRPRIVLPGQSVCPACGRPTWRVGEALEGHDRDGEPCPGSWKAVQQTSGGAR